MLNRHCLTHLTVTDSSFTWAQMMKGEESQQKLSGSCKWNSCQWELRVYMIWLFKAKPDWVTCGQWKIIFPGSFK